MSEVNSLSSIPRDVLFIILDHVSSREDFLKPQSIPYFLVSKKFYEMFKEIQTNYFLDEFKKFPLTKNFINTSKLTSRENKENIEREIARIDEKKDTLLHQAIREACSSKKIGEAYGLIYILLKWGIKPDTLNLNGHSPLSLLLLNMAEDILPMKDDFQKIAKILLTYGAEPNGIFHSHLLLIMNNLPLSDEMKNFQLSLLDLLCRWGANPDVKNQKDGWTPREYATKNYRLALPILENAVTKGSPSLVNKIFSIFGHVKP